MEVLALLKQAVETCADVIKWGAGIQENARKALVQDLQTICLNCEAAYDAILKRLVPVKDSFSDRKSLAKELRAFASDGDTRNKFKPAHLCGQVEQLLVKLGSYLDPLKYSVDFRRIQEVRDGLNRFGNYDGAIYQSYDDMARELDTIATQMADPSCDADERSRYAQRVVQLFETDLRAALKAMRDAKSQMVGII